MTRRESITSQLDWITVMLYFLIVLLGWLNIYAAVYDASMDLSIFDNSLNSSRQLYFIGGAVLLIIVILVIDFRFYDTFAFFIYGGVIFILMFVLLFGTEVAGSKSWFEVGPFRLQPSEFAKFASALAIAKMVSLTGFRMDNLRNQLILFALIGVPAILIILQGDTGTAMVFAAFMLVFYREGMSPFLLILGVIMGFLFVVTLLVENQNYLYIAIAVMAVAMILLGKKTMKRMALIGAGALIVAGFIGSVDYIISDFLKPHQQNRIKALINPEADPLGAGWNVTQSKIAIGSGGFSGKGFLEGTQTKYDFVPEQSTDFIFCTIGEEHGWIGSLLLIGMFVTLLLRVLYLAERQKSRFARVYGYGVACILFFHFGVNIGMTIGLFPVVGIPLPFFSYGGSSLWAFTILLFIFLKLDAHRGQVLTH
jgi:rod shape determining protein RodA